MKRPWLFATATTFAIALFLTFPAFLPGRVLLPLDHPSDLGAWKRDPATRYEISNKIVSDPIYEYLAWDIEVRRLLRSGEMPWRNRWAGEGAHLYANPETALLFPFTWPRLLIGEHGWEIMALLKLWAGGLGLWWLARLLGGDWRLALFGAAVYAMSGYMTMWLLFPHTNVFAALPWLAGSALSFIRVPSRRWATAIIATAALATAGGHPETLFHGVIAIAIFTGILGARVSSPARRFTIALLALTGFLLLSIQLVPFAIALSKSDIVQTRSANESHHVRYFAAAAQLLPGFLGSPLKGEIDLSGIAQPEADNFNERNAGYAGLITLLTIALAWRRLSRPLKVGLIIGIATLVIAWRLPLLDDLVHALPLFGIAANERFPLVFVLFVAAALPSALAIVGSDAPRPKLGTAIAVLALASAAAVAFLAVPAGQRILSRAATAGIEHMQGEGFLQKPTDYYEERLQHYLEGLRVVALRRIAAPLILLGIAGLALAMSRRRAMMLGSAVVLEMLLFAWGYAPAVHIRDAATAPPAIEEVRRLDPSNDYLIAAAPHVYDANLGTIHGVRDIRSYDVLQEHSRIERLVMAGYDRDSRAFPQAPLPLAKEGVRFYLSSDGVRELPNAVPISRPANSPPAGLLLGACISAVAAIAAVALVRLLPYHSL